MIILPILLLWESHAHNFKHHSDNSDYYHSNYSYSDCYEPSKVIDACGLCTDTLFTLRTLRSCIGLTKQKKR